MALILNIDTALDIASVSAAANGVVLTGATNGQQKDHAAWVHNAIKDVLAKSGKEIGQISAVAVSIGPGSFTGLRVGLATAKGLCYALNIPLITVGTLETMALSAITTGGPGKEMLVCPMIDARRMEVFAAVYDLEMNEIMKPSAMVLDADSFAERLKWQKILFLGNGSEKFQFMCKHAHAEFKKLPLDPAAMAHLSYKNFIGNNFAGLAYTEPLYLKEFYSRK